MTAKVGHPSGPRLTPVLEHSASRQVCLLDQSDRLTPWIALPASLHRRGASIDLSLRPVTCHSDTADQIPGLEAIDSAYDAAAQVSIWLLRKRPHERFSQARRVAFWELGRELMGLETNLHWRVPWLLAFWVPLDCRLQGLWLLEIEIQADAHTP